MNFAQLAAQKAYAVHHYRLAARFVLANTQAANSRLFEVRNPVANSLLVPTRLALRVLQIGAHTAAIEDSFDLFKCTSFSAVDNVNTVAPAASKKLATSPSTGAEVRHVTVAGAAAGMTGGTLTKDGSAISIYPKWLLAAVPAPNPADFLELLEQNPDEQPLALAQNEGIIIENRVLLGAAVGDSCIIEFSWAELLGM